MLAKIIDILKNAMRNVMNYLTNEGLINIFKLEATARPRSGQKRAGKRKGGLGEGIFARPPVLGGGWVCGCLRQPHKSEFGVGILLKVGSDFVQKVPPIRKRGCWLARSRILFYLISDRIEAE